jgi:hypothetical protein
MLCENSAQALGESRVSAGPGWAGEKGAKVNVTRLGMCLTH